MYSFLFANVFLLLLLLLLLFRFGEVVDCNLVRDGKSGRSLGFCFLAYEDQRSTILAIDNMNAANVLGRLLRVDHADKYRRPHKKEQQTNNGKEQEEDKLKVFSPEQDEDYDERRKRIWDYEKWSTSGNNKLMHMTQSQIMIDSQLNTKQTRQTVVILTKSINHSPS